MPVCERDMLNGLLVVVGILLAARVYFIDMGGAAAWAAGGDGGGSGGESKDPVAQHHAGGGSAHLVTPTSIPGPQTLRPLLGHCKLFKGPIGPTYEFCGFKSVRQIFVNPHASYYMGYFVGWKGEKPKDAPEGSQPKLVGQLYTGGDECPGFGNRQTLVKFVCEEEAKEPLMKGLKEDVPCQYEITIATVLWCGVDDEEGQGMSTLPGGKGTPTPGPAARRLRALRRKEAFDLLVGDDPVYIVDEGEKKEGREGEGVAAAAAWRA